MLESVLKVLTVCPLLERYVEFLPDQCAQDLFIQPGTPDNIKRLIVGLRREQYHPSITNWRVWASASLVTDVLFGGGIKHVITHINNGRQLPMLTTADDLTKPETLDHWLAFAARNYQERMHAHVEFKLESPEVQRGPRQLAEATRQRELGELTVLTGLLEAIKRYYTAPSAAHAYQDLRTIGQLMSTLCLDRGDIEFALHQGIRFLEGRTHRDYGGTSSWNGPDLRV